MILQNNILNVPGLLSFWDFQEEQGEERAGKGPYNYSLRENGGGIERVEGGIFGPYSAHMKKGKWFSISRRECPELDIHGENAEVTVIAWIKREPKEERECQAIAGMWNETLAQRQYCLFIDLKIWDSGDQVCAHISSVGGPTPGYVYCMDAAIGKTPIPYGQWQCVAFTYDSKAAKAYLNGKLDVREKYNPYPYEGGLYDGGQNGADFTVGSVFRHGEMGNWFTGLIGGLAVFNRALSEAEIESLSK